MTPTPGPVVSDHGDTGRTPFTSGNSAIRPNHSIHEEDSDTSSIEDIQDIISKFAQRKRISISPVDKENDIHVSGRKPSEAYDAVMRGRRMSNARGSLEYYTDIISRVNDTYDMEKITPSSHAMEFVMTVTDTAPQPALSEEEQAIEDQENEDTVSDMPPIYSRSHGSLREAKDENSALQNRSRGSLRDMKSHGSLPRSQGSLHEIKDTEPVQQKTPSPFFRRLSQTFVDMTRFRAPEHAAPKLSTPEIAKKDKPPAPRGALVEHRQPESMVQITIEEGEEEEEEENERGIRGSTNMSKFGIKPPSRPTSATGMSTPARAQEISRSQSGLSSALSPQLSAVSGLSPAQSFNSLRPSISSIPNIVDPFAEESEEEKLSESTSSTSSSDDEEGYVPPPQFAHLATVREPNMDSTVPIPTIVTEPPLISLSPAQTSERGERPSRPSSASRPAGSNTALSIENQALGGTGASLSTFKSANALNASFSQLRSKSNTALTFGGSKLMLTDANTPPASKRRGSNASFVIPPLSPMGTAPQITIPRSPSTIGIIPRSSSIVSPFPGMGISGQSSEPQQSNMLGFGDSSKVTASRSLSRVNLQNTVGGLGPIPRMSITRGRDGGQDREGGIDSTEQRRSISSRSQVGGGAGASGAAAKYAEALSHFRTPNIVSQGPQKIKSVAHLVKLASDLKQVGEDASLAKLFFPNTITTITDPNTLQMVIQLKRWAQTKKKKKTAEDQVQQALSDIKTRMVCEFPRSLRLDLINDSIPVIEAYVSLYRTQLGEKHSFTEGADVYLKSLKKKAEEQGYTLDDLPTQEEEQAAANAMTINAIRRVRSGENIRGSRATLEGYTSKKSSIKKHDTIKSHSSGVKNSTSISHVARTDSHPPKARVHTDSHGHDLSEKHRSDSIHAQVVSRSKTFHGGKKIGNEPIRSLTMAQGMKMAKTSTHRSDDVIAGEMHRPIDMPTADTQTPAFQPKTYKKRKSHPTLKEESTNPAEPTSKLTSSNHANPILTFPKTKKQRPNITKLDIVNESPSKKPTKPSPKQLPPLPPISSNTPPPISHSRCVFDKALSHIGKVDPKFLKLVDKVGRDRVPFERSPVVSTSELQGDGVINEASDNNGEINAFESLATSIIYQQLNGKVAAVILKRFLALFEGKNEVNELELDVESKDKAVMAKEEVEEDPNAALLTGGGGGTTTTTSPFPTASQVLSKPQSELLTAGLSLRKAEYMHSLASAFTSGQLTDTYLRMMPDETVIDALTRVKGIGRWTAQMFLMFGLKRVDVLPTGDLGVRKGMAVYFGVSEEELVSESGVRKSKVP
ncbi:3-methyladenine DNA glycosylase, partial [Blyttiomyces sp. JEL0837]